MNNSRRPDNANIRLLILSILRIAIGWHFLYEGLVKIMDPEWSAAGSLDPRDAFPYAFNQGADFICTGMYDFQIIDDVNITLDALSNVKDRRRPWRA